MFSWKQQLNKSGFSLTLSSPLSSLCGCFVMVLQTSWVEFLLVLSYGKRISVFTPCSVLCLFFCFLFSFGSLLNY